MIRKIFPILALSTFASMLGVGIITPLLPIYAESLGASGLVLGFIFASFSLSRGILMPFIGRLSDRKGRKNFIVSGLLIYTLISLGYLWASNTTQLIVVRLIHGAASGMIAPVAQAYIGEICPEGQVGRWMGYMSGVFSAGFGFGPFIGGVISEHFGMDTAYWVMFGINAAALIAASTLPREKGLRKSSPGFNSSFWKVTRSNTMKGLLVFRMVFELGFGILFTFLPIFAVSAGVTPTELGILIAILFMLMSSLQLITGRIADKLDTRWMVIIGGIIMMSFLGLLPFAKTFEQLLPLAIMGGIGCSIMIPASSAISVREGKSFGMGTTIAAIFMAMSVGAVTGPLFAGALADHFGTPWAFYFAAVCILMGTGTFHYFTAARMGRRAENIQ